MGVAFKNCHLKDNMQDSAAAIQIILDCEEEMRTLNAPLSRVQKYFSERKLRNIRLRKSNLAPEFKALVCSKFEVKSEVSGLCLALYRDSSGGDRFRGAAFIRGAAAGLIKLNEVFLGKLSLNQRNGFGHRLYPNGKVFIGDFKNDQKHGRGRLLDRDGQILYEGEYSSDAMHGKGKLHLPGQFFYSGEFSSNQMTGGPRCRESPSIIFRTLIEGNAKIIFQCGKIYTGEVRANALEGLGEMLFPNGDRYSGHFRNNIFEGKGKFESKSGKAVEGLFSKGVLAQPQKAEARARDPNERIFEGIIFENNFHKKKCFITNKNQIKIRSFAHQLTAFSNLTKSSGRAPAGPRQPRLGPAHMEKAQENAKACEKVFEESKLRKKSVKFKKCCTETLFGKLRARAGGPARAPDSAGSPENYPFKKHYSDGHSQEPQAAETDATWLAFRIDSESDSMYSDSATLSVLSGKLPKSPVLTRGAREGKGEALPKANTFGPKLNFAKCDFVKRSSADC